ncbi:MAG: hypothetical protein ACTS4U_00965 [Candidatus Hodgkinia cicadicola]
MNVLKFPLDCFSVRSIPENSKVPISMVFNQNNENTKPIYLLETFPSTFDCNPSFPLFLPQKASNSLES